MGGRRGPWRVAGVGPSVTPAERYAADPEFAAMVDQLAVHACMTVPAVFDGLATLDKSLHVPFQVSAEDIGRAIALERRRPQAPAGLQPPVPRWARKRWRP